MRRRWTDRIPAVAGALVTLAAFVLVPGVAAASGGGGCGGPVTDAEGTGVDIASFCFTPTILRVDAGEVVTFVNRDAAPHTVLGANGAWGGYDVLKRGREATYAFTEPGVFPYVCTYHAGMVGTIVVGDGVGGSIETTTAAGPVTHGASALQAAPVASSVLVRSDAGVWRWLAFASTGLLLLALAGLVVERKRRAR